MKKMIILCFMLLATAAPEALAQCARIKLAPGRPGAVVSGKTGANNQACYKLHAREGQRMSARVASPGGRARFSILPDGYDGDFLEGAESATRWEGELSSASGSGDFLIVVKSPRAGATFTLEVNIPSAGRAARRPSREAAATCGDFSGIYQTHYGPLRLTRTGDRVRGVYTSERRDDSSITGTVRGNVLTGRWREPGRGGTFRFELDPDGLSFTGSFAFDGDASQTSEWGGHCGADGNR